MQIDKLKLNIFALLLLSWLLLTSAIAATQWKWTDADGKVNYSDKPPPASVPKHKIVSYPSGIEFYVAIPGSKAPDAPKASDKPSNSAAAVEPNSNPAKKPQPNAAGVAQFNQYCIDLKDDLAKYKSGVRLSRVNAKGQKEFVLDEDRKRETVILEKRWQADCAEGNQKQLIRK